MCFKPAFGFWLWLRGWKSDNTLCWCVTVSLKVEYINVIWNLIWLQAVLEYCMWSLHTALLLLSSFSRVQLCVTPWSAAHQAPPSLGFSRQEHWSGLPFPSPMHESEKWKWSHSVVSDSSRPHGLQPARLLHPWDFPARVLERGAIAFSIIQHYLVSFVTKGN